MVDIIVITKPADISKIDPFALANKAYLTHTSARAFLNPAADPFPSPDDESRLIHNINLTLLPHQILVLPTSLERFINSSIFQTHAYYSDNDIK